MKIANIIYENELINHNRSEYINYVKYSDTHEEYDESLPTLFVGWKFLKRINSNNAIIQGANILDKIITKNKLMWEFSFDENKSSHVSGVNLFVLNAPHFYFIPKYNYVNLDPIFFKHFIIEEVLKSLPDHIDIGFKYKNDMLYLLSGNTITGINLIMYRFFGFDTDNIVDLITERTVNMVVDSDGEIYQQHYKIFPNYHQLKRYTVTMLK